jgi:hypothetical protein
MDEKVAEFVRHRRHELLRLLDLRRRAADQRALDAGAVHECDFTE